MRRVGAAARRGVGRDAGQLGTGRRVAELVSHCDYATGNVVFRGGLPVALIDFDLAMPTTRLYDIANALWYWAPLKWGDPQTGRPRWPSPTSRTGSRCSRTPMA